MCRWLAYSGSPVLLHDLLYKPENSLVVQSRHSRLGVEPVNGDGFGIGWYAGREEPGIYDCISLPGTTATCGRSRRRQLPGACSRTFDPLLVRPFSRRIVIRSATVGGCGAPGSIADFLTVKRDLILAVGPDLFPDMEGSTDSEVFFYLALTFGLEEDPPEAVARAVALIEKTGRQHGVEYPIQMTVATTDGETTWAFRYSSEGMSRSLFHSNDISTLRQQYPDNPMLNDISEDARLVVSEPLGDLRGAWREVPESTCLVVSSGQEELRAFVPSAP